MEHKVLNRLQSPINCVMCQNTHQKMNENQHIIVNLGVQSDTQCRGGAYRLTPLCPCAGCSSHIL